MEGGIMVLSSIYYVAGRALSTLYGALMSSILGAEYYSHVSWGIGGARICYTGCCFYYNICSGDWTVGFKC